MKKQEARDITKSVNLRFLYFLIGCYGICLPLLIFLPSYYSFDTSESISFLVKDGWCKPGQGIGIHCFGDFFYTFQYTNLIDPWSHGMNPQPPLGTFFYKLFFWYTSVNPYSKSPLLVYLALCLICALFPAWHLGWKRNRNIYVVICLTIATITFAPFLVALDRGSNQLLMIPFVYLFVTSILEKSNKNILKYGSLLILIKPQMMLLGIIFLFNRDFRNTFKWAALSVFLTLSSFLLYPLSYFKNIKDYAHQVIDYQNYTSAGAIYPVNISLPNLFSTINRLCNKIFPDFSDFITQKNLTSYSMFFNTTLLVVIAVAAWILGPKKDKFTQATIAVALPALVPTVSFHYYYCMFLGCYLLFIYKSFFQIKFAPDSVVHLEHLDAKGFTLTKTRLTLSLASILLLFIPWPIPWSILPIDRSIPVSFTWLIGQITMTILVFILIFSTRQENTNSYRPISIAGNR